MITKAMVLNPAVKKIQFDFTNCIELEAVEGELHNVISDSEGIVRDMCYHILNAGGKRIRPLLVIYSGNLFSSEKNDSLIQAAVAAELIHMASLVHDDIIDHSSLRRSKPSVNTLWGINHAVLCGDYLFCKAFEVLAQKGIVSSMKYMIEAIQSMCHGEILQASERYETNVNLSIYYNRIAKKTAVFLECCCKAGALLSGANSSQMDLIAQYGIQLGYAFQIIDDIHDFCGNPFVMGKPNYEDLNQGNLTLPVILLMEDKKYGDWIRQIISTREFTKENMNSIKLVLEEAGIISKSYDIVSNHLERAKKALNLVPASQYNDLLYNLTDVLKANAN